MTQFKKAELSAYAERFISDEVRWGIATLGFVSLLLLGAAAAIYALLGFDSAYVYTFSLLAILALHVAISTRGIKTTQMLYLLGMTLLIIAGTAFVLLAHKTGVFSAALLSSVVLLFMVVPLVPWGMREATVVVVLVYLVFTLSTVSVQGRFEAEEIWLLQFLMLGSAITTLTVVARNVAVRKHDIKTRFELEIANKQMELLSYKDPLTGTWNRRFLEQEYSNIVQQYASTDLPMHLALIDINDFKEVNDNHGHDCGDTALQHLAQIFMQQFQDNGFVIRLGGDEFMILFGHINPQVMLQQAIDALQSCCGLTNVAEDIPMHVSAGLVTVPLQQSAALDVLYKEADQVLYSAKSSSKQDSSQSHAVYRTYSAA